MFTKGELRRLRKCARRLQLEAGNAPIGHTSCFQVHFIAGRLMSGLLKDYHSEKHRPSCGQCFQAREEGQHYTYGQRLPL